jgi:hypothetical protein
MSSRLAQVWSAFRARRVVEALSAVYVQVQDPVFYLPSNSALWFPRKERKEPCRHQPRGTYPSALLDRHYSWGPRGTAMETTVTHLEGRVLFEEDL